MEQMRAAFERAEQRFEAIHAVIHGAGIAGGGVIQLKDARSAADVFSAKVRGTLVLDELLKDKPLDFFVLCSSMLALKSRAGQVDYCAANAFLDAYARWRYLSHGSGTISINWDGWKEVGMAAAGSARWRSGLNYGRSNGRAIDHPLLKRLFLETPDRAVYHTQISVHKHWMVDEHRILGSATLPGTAYLEMARAAFAEHFGREKIEFRDVFFLMPLFVRDDESKDVYTVLERAGEAYGFRIISRDAANHGEKMVWREHARGKIGDLIQTAGDSSLTMIGLESLNDVALERNRHEGTKRRGEMVYWGPRWSCVKAVTERGNEVSARLELAQIFKADLDRLRLHPALLDVATSLGLKYGSGDRYLPFSYGRVEVHHPLSPEIKVKVRENAASNSEILSFDALIMDQSGRLLVRVEAFSLKSVKDRSAWRNSGQNEMPPERDAAGADEAETQIEESLGTERRRQKEFDGILPQEGIVAFQRILSLRKVPQVIVSMTNVARAPEQPRLAPIASLKVESSIEQSSVPSRHSRTLQSAFAAPKNESESSLTKIWQEVLGIERVSVNDNFFELGGDSVIAIEVIAKANKAGLRLALADIFEHQTVAELAAACEAVRGQDTANNSQKQNLPPANDFGWTAEEKDKIARALTGSFD
jgi:acyl carrier protein